MGLLIGASAMTLLEVMDLLIYNGILKLFHRKNRVSKVAEAFSH